MIKFTTRSFEETIQLGRRIGIKIKENSILGLTGTLGAGKTALTKGIALGLDVKEDITSPTFTIINEYQGRFPFFHLDLYRIINADELLFLGLEELFSSKGVCVIEWSEKMSAFLPEDSVSITIKINPDNSRTFSIEGLEL